MRTKNASLGFVLAGWRLLTLSGLLLLASATLPAAEVTLVPAGAVWKYNDTGTDLGTAWRDPAFSDGSWASGPAQLGYGDGDEATLIRSSPVYPCYYFRRTFTLANPAAYQSLSLEILRDDGAIVYLNGQEVARYNMPAGTVTYSTWASSSSEYVWDPAIAIPNLLVAGDNVLAVEVHQGSSTSTDVSFDLKLVGATQVAIWLDSPPEGATGVSIPATLTATSSDPEGQPLTVNFYGRRAPEAVPDFTMVVLPDIQKYTSQTLGGTPDMFFSQINWVIANRQALNIAYVAQLGDISDNGDSDTDHSEWRNATNGFYRLEPEGIPYGLAVGNHDQIVPAGDTEPTTDYNQYFGLSRFQDRSYYGGHYGTNNNNHYDLFSASSLDFIVIYLEYDTTPDQAVLDWADALLKGFPERRGIVVSHYLLELTAAWGVQGQAIYDALRDNPNLFLMLCGHNHGEARRTDIYAGNSVHTLLADYQDYANGGGGLLRVVTFSPSLNEIQLKTYSPWASAYETDPASEFTLSYPMTGGPPFDLLQQNVGVPSGTQTSATWSGLLPGAEYEWLITASNGIETRTSEVRRFTTLLTTPPAVTITSPAEGASFAADPSAVTIQALATDADGSVASVEFFAGSISLGADLSEPYELTTMLGAGVHVLTALATDNNGAQTVSAPIIVTIGALPAAPTELTAMAQSRTEISLLWVDNASNESGFQILQSLDGTNYELIGTTESNVTSVSVTGLQLSTTYYYIVRAFNGLGYADSPPASATTMANHAPTALADTYALPEDTALLIQAPGVLANDTDVDGDSLAAILVRSPTYGTLNLNTDGSLHYTPNTNFNGTDSFSYKAADGRSESGPVEVTLQVAPVNDPPIANPDAYAVTIDTILNVAAPGLLGNDIEIDSIGLSVIFSSAPANGRLYMNSNGSFSYMPNAGFTGADSFTYVVSDGTPSTAWAVVTLAVGAQSSRTMHVSSIRVSSQEVGKGRKGGCAEVIIVDSGGNPVPGALVTGKFSGSIAQVLSATTGASGKAIFLTTTTVAGRNPRLTFTVDSVLLNAWTYDPAANLESSDRNY